MHNTYFLFLQHSQLLCPQYKGVFLCYGDQVDAQTKQDGGDDRTCGIRACAHGELLPATPITLLVH